MEVKRASTRAGAVTRIHRLLTVPVRNLLLLRSLLYTCSKLISIFFPRVFLDSACLVFKCIHFGIFLSSKLSQTMSHKLFSAFVKPLH